MFSQNSGIIYFFASILKEIKKNLDYFPIVVIFFIPFIYYKEGFYIHSTDATCYASPDILVDKISSIWNNNFHFGETIWAVTDSFLAIPFYLLHEMGLSVSLIQILEMGSLFAIAGLSIRYLTRIVFGEEMAIRFFAILFYLFNPFMFGCYLKHNLYCYAFLPVTIGILIKLGIYKYKKNTERNIDRILFLAFAFIIVLVSLINLSMLLMIVAAWIFSMGVGLYKTRLSAFKSYLIVFSVLFLTTFFALFPIFLTIMNFISSDTEINSMLFNFNWIHSKNQIYNLFRFLGSWAFYEENYHYAGYYYRPEFIILSYFFWMIVGWGILMGRIGKRVVVLLILVFSLLFIMKGYNAPFRYWMELFYKIPGAMMYREPVKLYILFYIPFSLLFGYSVSVCFIRIRKTNPYYSAPFTLMVTICVLLYAFPILTGDVIYSYRLSPSVKKNIQIRIPDYWFEAIRYIDDKNDSSKYRVCLLPSCPSPTNPYVSYEWCHTGDHIVGSLLKSDVTYNFFGYMSDPYVKKTISSIYTSITDNQYDRFVTLCEATGIKYLLMRNDLDRLYPKKYFQENIKNFENIVQQSSDIVKIKSFGKLDVYEINNPLPRIITLPIHNDVERLRENYGDPQSDIRITPLLNMRNTFANSSSDLPDIQFKKISSSSYEILVKNASDPFRLVFLDHFSKLWKARIIRQNTKDKNVNISFLLIRKMKEFMDGIIKGFYVWSGSNSKPYLHLFNSWIIEPPEEKQEFTILLFYKYQFIYSAAFFIMLFITCLCILYYLLLKFPKLRTHLFYKLEKT